MREIWKISLYGIVEYFLIFPLLFSFAIYMNMNEIIVWLIVVYSLFVVGVAAQRIIKWQNIGVKLIVSLAIGVATALFFEQTMMISLIHMLIIYRGFTFAQTRMMLPLNYLWFGGIGMYVIFYIVFRNVEPLKEWSSTLTVVGAMEMIAIMFITNQQHLIDASLSKAPTITRATRRQNNFALGLISLIIIIFAFGKSLQNLLVEAFRTMLATFFGLFSGGENNEPMMEEAPPASMDFNMPMDIKEPSKLAEILEKIFMYGVGVLVVVGFIGLILYSVKHTRKWVKKMIHTVLQLLRSLSGRDSQLDIVHEYVDETEKLFDFKEWRKERQEQVKDWMQGIFKRPINWGSLTNEEKMRELYKQFIRKHMTEKEYERSNTPRENSKKIAGNQEHLVAHAYEKIRYGEQPIDNESLEKIDELMRKND